MNRLAGESLTLLMDSIHTMADQVYSGSDSMTMDEEKERSRELMGQVRTFIKKDRPQAQLLAMNSRLKLTYPKADNELPDTQALLSYTGTLLILISSALCLLSLMAVWYVAGSISKPIQTLCHHAKAIGKGRFTIAQKPYSIRELEELRLSFNRMTQELEQMKQQQTAFFQNASHELRTPLMSICGYAQGIQCDVFPDHEKAAGIILDETMRMKELVDGILTISKMDGHHLRLEMTVIDLNEWIEDEISALKGMEISEHICLNFVPSEYTVLAEADPALLSRAFRNVISNGVRYAVKHVDVTVKEDNEYAVITIMDDGPGIGPRELAHIFDRFYKGAGGNFGIGLSVTAAAMEYMDGKAHVCNRELPGHGAVFSLYLRSGGSGEV